MINTCSDPTQYDVPIASIIDRLQRWQSSPVRWNVCCRGKAYMVVAFGIMAVVPLFLFKFLWIECVMM